MKDEEVRKDERMNECLYIVYLSCRAVGDSLRMREASLKALEAFCSPSAAII